MDYKLDRGAFINITYPYLVLPGLNLEQKAMLSTIANIQADGVCVAGNDYFAALLSCGKSTVYKHINILQEQGFLSVTYDHYRNGKEFRILSVIKEAVPGLLVDESTTDEPPANTDDSQNDNPPNLNDSDSRSNEGGYQNENKPSRNDRPLSQNENAFNNININKILITTPPTPPTRGVRLRTLRVEEQRLADQTFFELIWPIWPKGNSNLEASIKRWRLIRPTYDQALYVANCINQLKRTTWNGRESRHIPLCQNWLKAAGWQSSDATAWIQAELNRQAADIDAQKREEKRRADIEKIQEERATGVNVTPDFRLAKRWAAMTGHQIKDYVEAYLEWLAGHKGGSQDDFILDSRKKFQDLQRITGL